VPIGGPTLFILACLRPQDHWIILKYFFHLVTLYPVLGFVFRPVAGVPLKSGDFSAVKQTHVEYL
jgi:hypothetical protein